MTESFRYEEPSSERVQPEDSQVEVFFDGNTARKPASIVLDTAALYPVVVETPYGQLVYDDLILDDGTVLSPADLSPELTVSDFANSLEPLVQFGAGALLQTLAYRREMKFLEIIKNNSSVIERRKIRETLQHNEENRIPSSILRLNELFDDDDGLELWIRLEAIFDPDEELVGRIIIARLACFRSHVSVVGVAPMIYDALDGIITPIPEQLAVNDNWLYYELN